MMCIMRQKPCCRSRGGVLAFEGVDDLASREWVEQMPLIVLVSTGAGLLGSLFNLMHKWLFKVSKAGRGLAAVQLLFWCTSLCSGHVQLALLCLMLFPECATSSTLQPMPPPPGELHTVAAPCRCGLQATTMRCGCWRWLRWLSSPSASCLAWGSGWDSAWRSLSGMRDTTVLSFSALKVRPICVAIHPLPPVIASNRIITGDLIF